MKHLLNGVAIAAILAVAAPAWAQSPPAKAPAAAPAPAGGTMQAKPMKPMKSAAMPMHKKHMKKRHKMSSDDAMTDQLNREELARIKGGGAAPAPAPAPAAPAK